VFEYKLLGTIFCPKTDISRSISCVSSVLRILENEITVQSRVLFEKLIVTQLVKNSQPCMEPEVPIILFVRSRYRAVSWVRKSRPHPPCLLRFCHLRQDIPCSLFPWGYATKISYVFIICFMCTTCHTHLILLHFIALIICGEEYKLWRSSYKFFQPPVTFSPVGQNNFLSTLFSDTRNLFSSLNVGNRVSHPYISTGRSVALYFIFTFLRSRRQKNRTLWTEW
jgi:hypothetical protein